jgi:RNase H-fold protein (predicted Holliday junction resolvase)
MHKLLSKLSKPSKVASALDWKKFNGSTVLSLNFHQDRVGIAVASHPSTGNPCIELEPLRFNQNHIAIDESCLNRFSKIIEEYKVCGVVVSWPLQHDTGRMGAACGRVIYSLEQLWEKSNGGSHPYDVLARPFCLWDSSHIIPKQRKDPAKRVDEFGRCASYGKKDPKKKDGAYFASVKRYHEDELAVVCGVWDDFCKEHWPELYTTSFAEPDDLKRQIKKEEFTTEDDVKMKKAVAESSRSPAAGNRSATTNTTVSYGT